MFSIPVQAGTAGETGFSFLSYSPYARSAGMAEATTGYVGDAMMIYSNPAGLAHMAGRDISFQHISHLQDVSYQNAAFVRPLRRGSLGFAVGVLSVRDIPRTLADGSSPEGYVEAGDIKAGNQYAAASWGWRQSRDLSLGATAKFAREELDTASAVSFMGDAGAILRHGPQVRFAAALQNVGTSDKFVSQSVSPPARLRAGVYYIHKEYLTCEADLVRYFYGETEVMGGFEYSFTGRWFLRAGYRYRSDLADLGTFTGASAGLGAKFSSFKLDYAFVPFGDLGESHRFSLTWRFHVEPEELPSASGRRPPRLQDLPENDE